MPKICVLFFVPLLLLAFAAPARCGEDVQDVADMLDMFEEQPAMPEGDESAVSPSPPARPSAWNMLQFSGEGTIFAAYAVNGDSQEGIRDSRDLSRLRTGLRLDADLRPDGPWRAHAGIRAAHDAVPALKGREGFSDDYVDDVEWELEPHEVYVLASPTRRLDIKFGRQIVAWGTSESIRVTDILNPMDKREPGLTDIEDLRLPVCMTRLDYYPDTTWSVSAIAVHETRFDKEPPWGSGYHVGTAKRPEEDEPEFSLENQEAALALLGRMSGLDVSLNAAWVLDDTPYYQGTDRKHSRVGMVGATAQAVHGNWLYKAEGAFVSGMRSTPAPEDEFCRYDQLVGAEYSGFTETTVTMEFVNRHMIDFDWEVAGIPSGLRKDDSAASLRVSRDYLNDTLHLLATGTFALPVGRGGLGRMEASYDINDSMTFRMGYAFYFGDDTALYETLKENDQIFTELKYHF